MQPQICISCENQDMKLVKVEHDAKSQSKASFTKHYVCTWCKVKFVDKGVQLD